MATITGLEVWTDFQCAGGTRKAWLRLDMLSKCVTVSRATREDTLAVIIPVAFEQVAEVTFGRVLRLVYSDATFSEYRIARVQETGGRAAGVIEVDARGPLYDLGDTVLLYTDTGTTRAAGLALEGNVGVVLDALLASWLPTWWDKGTVPAIPVAVSGESPLELLRAVCTQLSQASGAAYELDIRRNGTVGYYIDVVTSVGASAATVDVITGKNLLTSERIADRSETVTAVQATCSDGTTIAGALWVVASIAGNDVELRAPEGTATPVQFTNQYVGWYLENDQSPAGYTLISASNPSTGKVTVASTAGIAVNERVRLVMTSTGVGAIQLVNPGVTPVRVASYSTGKRSATNQIKNPIFNDWTAGAPDDWTQAKNVLAAAYTLVQETTLVQYGVNAVKWSQTDGTYEQGIKVVAPYNFPGTVRIRVRVRVYTSANRSVYVQLVDNTTPGNLLTAYFPTASVISSANGWRTVELDSGTATTPLPASSGPFVRVWAQGALAFDTVVDAVMLTVDTALPTGMVVGSGLCDAWLAANAYLADRAPPAYRYSFELADLHAIAPSEFPNDALVVGGLARIRDTDLDLTTTQRLLELTQDWKNPARSRAVYGRVVSTLTRQLAGRTP